MTLTDFLLARIAEDEEDAGRIVYDDGGMNFRPYSDHWLAECEAKRRIVAEHESVEGAFRGDDRRCRLCTIDRYEELAAGNDPECFHEQLVYPCPTLRALAAVYADHPDYREEWKP